MNPLINWDAGPHNIIFVFSPETSGHIHGASEYHFCFFIYQKRRDIFTKTSQLYVHANLLFVPIHPIAHSLPNNRVTGRKVARAS
jgi:hypothetical protein